MTQLSVIVCCYNSADLIKNTLTHLANQITEDGLKYEIVLVDNNSCDQTAQIARDIWNKLESSVPLKVITEFQPGLSYARRKGILESNGDILIFCDDDNWLDEDYLQTSYSFMIKNPEVGALGGQSEGILEVEEPRWWQKNKTSYAVGKQAGNSGDITQRGYVWGAGIVVRKIDLTKLYKTGFVPLLSGRKGENLTSGDDSELCKWIMLMGYKLWYLEALKFKHYIPEKRLTEEYLEKLLNGHHQSQTVLKLYHWFYYSGIYRKIDRFKLTDRFYYLKKAIKKFIEKDNEWKKNLQLGLGSTVRIQSDLYQIIKTYERLNS